MNSFYKNISLLTFLCCFLQKAVAQVSIGNTSAVPHASAMLDINAGTNSIKKGLLIPRMTSTQRIAITAPAQGLLVYDTDTKSQWQYNGSMWVNGIIKLSYNDILLLPNPQAGDLAYDLTNNCLRVYSGTRWNCSYEKPTLSTVEFSGSVETSNTLQKDMAMDASGNIYVTGYFYASVNFDGIFKTSAGAFDFFIAKYNSNYQCQWVQTIGNSGNSYGYGVDVDPAGNVYAVGTFDGTITIGSNTITSAGLADVLLAKYDNNGNLLWLSSAGGTGNDWGNEIAVNATHLFITGSFEGTAYFDTENRTSSGGKDCFIAKYNGTTKTINWLRVGQGSFTDEGKDIKLDTSNNVVVVGSFNTSATFGSSMITGNLSEIFLVKYSNGGNLLWAKADGGTGNQFGEKLALNNSGEIFITGNFKPSANLANIAGYDFTAYSIQDFFVAKYTSLGVGAWAKSGFASPDEFSYSTEIAVVSDELVIAGYFQGVLNFGGSAKLAAGDYDIFIAKLDNSNGLLKWLQTAGGISVDLADGLSILNNDIFFSCNISDDAYFGSTFLPTNGTRKMVFVKIPN